ncbi:MAG: alpha/beta hydrolase [Pirellulales bacterium]|nr:alpha/beta hydrolase [Pirellulales bacterium]
MFGLQFNTNFFLVWCRVLLVIMTFALSLIGGAVDGTAGEDTTNGQHNPTCSNTQFSITLDPSVADKPVSGRLFVFLSQRAFGQPMNGPNWFGPEPFFGLDVDKMTPGESIQIDEAADGFPGKLSDLPAGKYRAQALLDHDFYRSSPSAGEGNFYSDVIEIEIGVEGSSDPIAFQLTNTVGTTEFPETEFIKQVVIKSELLSEFHGREVLDRCGVVLPPSYYDEPKRRYPVIFRIPGFGGSHYSAARGGRRQARGEGIEEFIQVFLTGECKWGHHVYADSENNGPRGATLVQELIPYLDQNFRTVPESYARFLTGHSSGGWSTLWLQVSYPDVFGGTWSTAPDPVDFRDFQLINIYAEGELMFVDNNGARRPLARRPSGDGRSLPVLMYDDFCKMDDVLKRGGQLRSFEAVFSPRGEDGEPLWLWNRETGEIDPQVAKAWEAYDINLILQRNWETLGPKLAGKVTIIAGGLDTFYLDGAVVKLKETLTKLKSNAVIEIIPGADHGSFMTQEVTGRISREMSEAFRKHHGQRSGLEKSTAAK